jgi:hypothetical protein
MILFRACPRCGGDLLEENELGGEELVCIQCAFRTALPPGIVLKHERAQPKGRPSRTAPALFTLPGAGVAQPATAADLVETAPPALKT